MKTYETKLKDNDDIEIVEYAASSERQAAENRIAEEDDGLLDEIVDVEVREPGGEWQAYCVTIDRSTTYSARKVEPTTKRAK